MVRSQTAAASYKPAVLENGVRIMVPPHIEAGTRVVVNIAEASYVERARTEQAPPGHGAAFRQHHRDDPGRAQGGRPLVRDFGEVENLQVSIKGPGDFVSAADRRAEQTLRRELSRARPGFGFLEESGLIPGEDREQRWVVDPLDGTTNFLHGLPHFAISIALERRGELLAGVVYDPIKDELFCAEKGAAPISTTGVCACRDAAIWRPA